MNWDRQTSASDSFSKLVSGGLEASKRISKYGSSARGWIDWIGLSCMVMSQIRYFTDVVLSRFDVIILILGGIELASQVQEFSFEYLIVASRSRFGGDISCLSEMFVYGG